MPCERHSSGSGGAAVYEPNFEDCSGARDHQPVVGDPFSPFSRAQGGDASAIEELVERHRDDVYGFLLQMTRSEAAASELTGQSFLSSHRRLKEFKSEAEYAAWLHRAAADWALRTCPGGTGERVAERNFELPDHTNPAEYSPSDWSQSAPETALNDELRQAIEEATNRLSPPSPNPDHHPDSSVPVAVQREAGPEVRSRPALVLAEQVLRLVKRCRRRQAVRHHTAIESLHQLRGGGVGHAP